MTDIHEAMIRRNGSGGDPTRALSTRPRDLEAALDEASAHVLACASLATNAPECSSRAAIRPHDVRARRGRRGEMRTVFHLAAAMPVASNPSSRGVDPP